MPGKKKKNLAQYLHQVKLWSSFQNKIIHSKKGSQQIVDPGHGDHIHCFILKCIWIYIFWTTALNSHCWLYFHTQHRKRFLVAGCASIVTIITYLHINITPLYRADGTKHCGQRWQELLPFPERMQPSAHKERLSWWWFFFQDKANSPAK